MFLIFIKVIRSSVGRGEMRHFLKVFAIPGPNVVCLERRGTDLLHLRLVINDLYQQFEQLLPFCRIKGGTHGSSGKFDLG